MKYHRGISMKISMKVPQTTNEISLYLMKYPRDYMNEKHRQPLIGDFSLRGVALYTLACRHLPVFIDKSGAHQSWADKYRR